MNGPRVKRFHNVISQLALKGGAGTWVRVIPLEYLRDAPPRSPPGADPNPLWAGGTHLTEARYIPLGLCDAYHISDGASTGMAEFEPLGVPVPDPVFGAPRTDVAVLRVAWHLEGILDLCDQSVRDALTVSSEDLVSLSALLDAIQATGDPHAETVTQEIGRAAYRDPRVSAIRYPSARRVGGTNIVVLTERLTIASGQFLEVPDPIHRRTWRIPP